MENQDQKQIEFMGKQLNYLQQEIGKIQGEKAMFMALYEEALVEIEELKKDSKPTV